jgi:hypothetical protein
VRGSRSCTLPIVSDKFYKSLSGLYRSKWFIKGGENSTLLFFPTLFNKWFNNTQRK